MDTMDTISFDDQDISEAIWGKCYIENHCCILVHFSWAGRHWFQRWFGYKRRRVWIPTSGQAPKQTKSNLANGNLTDPSTPSLEDSPIQRCEFCQMVVNAVLVSVPLVLMISPASNDSALRLQVTGYLMNGDDNPEQAIHTVSSAMSAAKSSLAANGYDVAFLAHLRNGGGY